MKLKVSTLSLLVLAAFSTAALAVDPGYQKQLDMKAANMTRCADIARALEKIPVPPGEYHPTGVRVGCERHRCPHHRGSAQSEWLGSGDWQGSVVLQRREAPAGE